MPILMTTDPRAAGCWRAYVAATIRLRRLLPDAAPRERLHLALDRVIGYEREIRRITGAHFQPVFEAGQADADQIARKHRRYLP